MRQQLKDLPYLPNHNSSKVQWFKSAIVRIIGMRAVRRYGAGNGHGQARFFEPGLNQSL